MCGISGIYAFNEIGRFFAINATKANETLSHRGPDFGKVYADYRVGLGHRRLSIIDLSPDANQPFTDETGRYVMVYNGEIYNFKALRDQLQQEGVNFRTHSDTEVLLYWFLQKGTEGLKALNGFFSFAFYDSEEETMTLVRDRYGIKPLVYFQDEDKLIFASEVTALLTFNIEKEIDYNSLWHYFQLHYIPAPHSIFKNVHKLLPGHFLKVKKGEENQPQKWYDLQAASQTYEQAHGTITSYASAKTELQKLLEASVKDRMISDVPLGAFLSGGIDSSAVVAYASRFTDKLHTFSVGYRDEPLFDETKYAKLVAKKYKTDHTVFELTNRDLFDHIFELLDFYAEPFADSSAIPVYILSKRTRQKVTVALSGDGADEVFAGYNKYMGEYRVRFPDWKAGLVKSLSGIWAKLPHSRNSFIGNKARQLHRFAEASRMNAAERYWFLCTWNTEERLQRMFHNAAIEKVDQAESLRRKHPHLRPVLGNDFNEVLRADLSLLLPNDMLHKVDSMSMAHALEVRVPFLDHRVVAFANGLPAEYKINGNMKKRLLQDAVRELLPLALYKRPKHGFDVPLMKGFQTELKEWVNECFDNDLIEEQQIFNPAFTESWKNEVLNTIAYDQNQVWAFLAFQHWWKKFMKI